MDPSINWEPALPVNITNVYKPNYERAPKRSPINIYQRLSINIYKCSSIQHDARENVNKLHFMNNFPVYINLTLYSAFYDIMYFYISTYNLMMVSNNSDTARYSNRNISPVSLKMAVLISSSKMKARLRYSSLFVNV